MPSRSDKTLADLNTALSAIKDRAFKALKIEAFNIMTRSRTEFAPMNDGDLVADSGATVDDTTFTITLWYGKGAAKAYAVPAHETPSAHDPPSWKGKTVSFKHGGSKYLERPLLDALYGMSERIADRTRR